MMSPLSLISIRKTFTSSVLRIRNYELRITNYYSRITHHASRITNYYLLITFLGIASLLAYLHLATTYPLFALIEKHLLTDFGRINGYTYAALYDFVYSLFIPFGIYLVAWQ